MNGKAGDETDGKGESNIRDVQLVIHNDGDWTSIKDGDWIW